MKFQGRFFDEKGEEVTRWFAFPTEEALKEQIARRGWRIIEYKEIKEQTTEQMTGQMKEQEVMRTVINNMKDWGVWKDLVAFKNYSTPTPWAVETLVLVGIILMFWIFPSAAQRNQDFVYTIGERFISSAVIPYLIYWCIRLGVWAIFVLKQSEKK